MILTAKPSSRGSRAAFWVVLGMGLLLLPLAPGLARVEALGEAEDSEAKSPAGTERERTASESPHQKIHQMQLDMQKCASCHDSGTHQLGDWLRKPQAWREAHDEAVRLMGEMKRLQSQFRDTAQRLPAPAASNRDEQIEKLQDEIELLKLQVRLKETRLRSTKGALDQARQLRDSALKQNTQVPGSASREEIIKAASGVDSLIADLEIKAIELEETKLRLKQAERHLARLQRPAEQSSPQPPQSLSLDLGSHRHGTIIERSFPLRNGHGSPLRIASIRSSSGALSVRTFQKEIASGEKGNIVLRLDTGRFVGSKTFTLFIQFEGGQSEIRVQIQAESVPPPPPRTATVKPDKEAQLKELERKLEILLKEVRDLQRDKRPDAPSDPNATPKSNRP